MNFYSDLIEKAIVDEAPLETLIDDLEKFKEDSRKHLLKMAKGIFFKSYIKNVLEDNIIAYHCQDMNFDMNNCPALLVYRKEKEKYYVLFVCTSFRFRGQGYASRLLDGLIERIKKENNNAKIILSSVYESVLFYEAYGFTWLGNCIKEYPILLNYEKYEEDKEYFIMEYDICQGSP